MIALADSIQRAEYRYRIDNACLPTRLRMSAATFRFLLWEIHQNIGTDITDTSPMSPDGARLWGMRIEIDPSFGFREFWLTHLPLRDLVRT